MEFDASLVVVPVSPDGEGGIRPESATVASPTNSLESWEEKLPHKEAFALNRVSETFNVPPSGVGLMALVSELRLDLAQLSKFYPLPDWVASLDSLRISLLQLGLDPARDLAMLRRQPMTPLRQFLTPPARSLSIGAVFVMRALRAMVALNLLAAKERLSKQIGATMTHVLSGKEAFRLDIRTASESVLRACWAELEPTAPLAKLLTFSLEVFNRILPNPFKLPRSASFVSQAAEQKSSPQLDDDCNETRSPEHPAGDLLDAFLVEPAVAGGRVFSGIAVLYEGLTPFELESTMPALFSIWKASQSEECLAAFFTLFLRVMPSAFGKVWTSPATSAWLFVDAKNGRFGWRLTPVLDKSVRDQGSPEWINSQIVWMPFPVEVAKILSASTSLESGGTLASFFSTPPKELAKKAKQLLRSISRTSHRPTLSRLSRSWARYLLADSRDEVYASAIGIDFTVGTAANFNYTKLQGARIRQICAAAYIHFLITQALRAATGSCLISPHDLRGAFISCKAGGLLAPQRDKSLDTLALRQGIPELSAQAGHGHAGVTIENYLCDLDVLWRQWMDVILEEADCPPSIAFISGVTQIPAATYRKRMSRHGALTFDVMEGFDGGQLAKPRIQTAGDLVLEGISQLEWDRDAEADGGLTRRAIYTGLRLLGEGIENARLPLSIKLIIPAADQAALQLHQVSVPGVVEVDGAFSNENQPKGWAASPAREDNSAGACDGTPSIEESGLMEAEDLARMSRKVTLASLDVAEQLVDRAEQEQVPLEAATEEFSKSPDEDVARKAYSRARGSVQIIEFLTDQRILGGNRKIPSELDSSATFKLKNCQVYLFGAKQRLDLRGDAGDEEWLRLQNTYPGVCTIGTAAEGTVPVQFLRYAELEGLNADVVVCVQEHPGKRRRSLIPLRVANSEEIISAVQARLSVLMEAAI